ncbi:MULTISPECIES: hypothetical protein [unclassified Pseudoxanthomonas]|uniref:hypothetical protein n=1 Tax=unclassified Pseudoxanthomonas TaxID=2645906 RepID=UPI0018320366|nr:MULTISPECIES: hypothetical protein [unclassified Pseudoxanthomonas]MBB3274339.1 hypothetical protein [Pseudoxanthomonas sp. OG2]
MASSCRRRCLCAVFAAVSALAADDVFLAALPGEAFFAAFLVVFFSLRFMFTPGYGKTGTILALQLNKYARTGAVSAMQTHPLHVLCT